MLQKFSNKEIARLLRQVSASYTIKGENRFRIIAYDKAAETIEKSDLDIKDQWEENRLSELPGIGTTIAGHLDELFKTGKVRHFQTVFRGLPPGMFPLLDVPGFGPKKAYNLSKEFKLNNPHTVIRDLLNVAKSGRIAPLPGYGSKSEKDIIEALERSLKGQHKAERMSLPYANVQAEFIIEYLKKNKDIKDVVPLGSLRRKVATIGDIDLAVSTFNPDSAIEWFIKYPKKTKVVEVGKSAATIIAGFGQEFDLRTASPDSFGSMLQYFTGSMSHNIHLREYALKKGLSLSEYGIKNIKTNKLRKYTQEEDFYKALGLPWIPPEIREDWGEIEAAQQNRLPDLVERGQIKGEVHVHSNYDLEPSHDLGESSLEELLKEAQKLNYQYLGISDHNPKVSNLSEMQIIAIMKRRKEIFEHILLRNKSVRVKLFIMLEIDILPDGKLALPSKAFEYIDAAIVSIHSVFNMGKSVMTERIIKGLSHPKAKILAHPSGRLIGKREGYEADWKVIFDFCKEHNKALEINSYPDRLDLADIMVRRAVDNGNKLIINTDSHHKDQMLLMDYGVSVARRGWAPKNAILNTLDYGEFNKWLTS